MNTIQQPVVLSRQDQATILNHLRHQPLHNIADRQSANALMHEVKRARLLDESQLPAAVVRLGSRVKVRYVDTNALVEFTVVTPDRADLKQRKISVLSPLGTALIGFCAGVTVKWKVPAGEKLFFIESVCNDKEAAVA